MTPTRTPLLLAALHLALPTSALLAVAPAVRAQPTLTAASVRLTPAAVALPRPRLSCTATLPSRLLRTGSCCMSEAVAPVKAQAAGSPDPIVARLRKRLWGVGWLSWWVQTILTVVSAVLLFFASAVKMPSPAMLGGLLLALTGLATSFCSMLWTWGYTRISVRLGKQAVAPKEAAQRAAGALRKGLLLNLLGMGVSLLGAEAIIGTLTAKALTQAATVAAGSVSAPVQALDLLIVQANTNTLAAHFCGVCATLRLLRAARACEDEEL